MKDRRIYRVSIITETETFEKSFKFYQSALNYYTKYRDEVEDVAFVEMYSYPESNPDDIRLEARECGWNYDNKGNRIY